MTLTTTGGAPTRRSLRQRPTSRRRIRRDALGLAAATLVVAFGVGPAVAGGQGADAVATVAAPAPVATVAPVGAQADVVAPATAEPAPLAAAPEPTQPAEAPAEARVEAATAATGAPETAAAPQDAVVAAELPVEQTAVAAPEAAVATAGTGAGEAVWALGPAPVASGSSAGQPGPTNTGLPAGTPLRVHDGDLTITTAGTVVDGLDIRGYVRVKAPNVVIKNSIIRGRPGLTGYMSLIQSPYPDNNLLVQDTTLVAANPTPYVDGIVGKGFTLRRVNIHGVVDQVKITGDNVLVEDSWLHDNLYYLQDPNYGNTPTHDDNVQVQAGRNITIRNNVLESTHNAAMMITQDAGAVANLTFTNNRANHGACTINVAEKSYGPPSGLRITNNTFGRDTRNANCAVLMKTTTSAVATVTGNVFTDGKAVTVSRG